jgi:signal peptidase I
VEIAWRRLLQLLVVIFFLIWFQWFRPLFLGGPTSYIIVSGISMEPTMYTGDLAILQKQQRYQVGDVVAFQVPGGNVIHRIIGGSAEEGFILQGDNKNGPDPWFPKPEHILGKLWVHLPGVGHHIARLQEPVPIAVLTALLLFGSMAGAGKGSAGSRRRKRVMGRRKRLGY